MTKDVGSARLAEPPDDVDYQMHVANAVEDVYVASRPYFHDD